jgi:hypothetical protein
VDPVPVLCGAGHRHDDLRADEAVSSEVLWLVMMLFFVALLWLVLRR